jgi:hypothetical protein
VARTALRHRSHRRRNAEEFAEIIAPYVSASRKVGRGQRLVRSSQHACQGRSSEIDPKAVRKWASENGVEVSPRGRINAKVLEQYRAAQVTA